MLQKINEAKSFDSLKKQLLHFSLHRGTNWANNIQRFLTVKSVSLWWYGTATHFCLQQITTI